MIDGEVLRAATDAELWMLLDGYATGACWLWAEPGCRAAEALLDEAAEAVRAELRRRGVWEET